jgi:membrane protein involved in colicin uptake
MGLNQLILSDRSNANRKALLMIAKGEAPSMKYKIEKRGEKQFAIVWGANDEAPADEPTMAQLPIEPEHMAPQTSAEAEAPATEPAAEATAKAEKRASKRQEREARKARIRASGAANGHKPSGPAKQSAKRGPRGSKYDAAFGQGAGRTMPTNGLPPKLIVNSPTNPTVQRHIDRMTELAETGKWDELAAYKLSESTTQYYPPIMRRYREQLLAARPA